VKIGRCSFRPSQPPCANGRVHIHNLIVRFRQEKAVPCARGPESLLKTSAGWYASPAGSISTPAKANLVRRPSNEVLANRSRTVGFEGWANTVGFLVISSRHCSEQRSTRGRADSSQFPSWIGRRTSGKALGGQPLNSSTASTLEKALQASMDSNR